VSGVILVVQNFTRTTFSFAISPLDYSNMFTHDLQVVPFCYRTIYCHKEVITLSFIFATTFKLVSTLFSTLMRMANMEREPLRNHKYWIQNEVELLADKIGKQTSMKARNNTKISRKACNDLKILQI
jgi:hypothetical protein